mmetsp:Transcript_25685/g.54874  ORF Transcript_25685/g.54874 Transcript_25685/m.54874 type:complete len:94 (+) Transcript_25685:1164-1445(+)
MEPDQEGDDPMGEHQETRPRLRGRYLLIFILVVRTGVLSPSSGAVRFLSIPFHSVPFSFILFYSIYFSKTKQGSQGKSFVPIQPMIDGGDDPF